MPVKRILMKSRQTGYIDPMEETGVCVTYMTGNMALSLYYTLSSSPLHTH
jgi:hypothetical protein